MLTRARGLVHRVYAYAAALALLNVLALLVGVGAAFATGTVSLDDVQRAVGAFRGGTARPTDGAGGATKTSAQEAAADAGDPFRAYTTAEAQMETELLHREAERIKVELDQRLALNNRILLKVRAERQTFENEREAAAKKDEEQRRLVRDEGFEKQVAIFEALKPKIAAQHLLGMDDADAAARLLTAIGPDRARRVVEAARREPELSEMQVILQRVRDSAPPQPAGGPRPP